MSKKIIYITKNDLKRLNKFLEYQGIDLPYIEKLKKELSTAVIFDSKEIPEHIVTMNSIVHIKYLDTGEEKTFILVFPDKADSVKKISVLSPLGSSVLGYHEGDIFEWEFPEGVRKLQIMEIIYQPERVGNLEL